MKRLYRSKRHAMVFGILGGIAEYLRVDPTVVRVVYLILLICTAFIPLSILYFVLYFVIPGEDNY